MNEGNNRLVTQQEEILRKLLKEHGLDVLPIELGIRLLNSNLAKLHFKAVTDFDLFGLLVLKTHPEYADCFRRDDKRYKPKNLVMRAAEVAIYEVAMTESASKSKRSIAQELVDKGMMKRLRSKVEENRNHDDVRKLADEIKELTYEGKIPLNFLINNYLNHKD